MLHFCTLERYDMLRMQSWPCYMIQQIGIFSAQK